MLGRWIAFAFTPRIILRGGTQRIPRERCVLKEGGFETRPYKPPDLCAASRQGDTAIAPGPNEKIS
jgi:hypothetical protein